MRYCTNCGHKIEGNFCPVCGTRRDDLSDEEEQIVESEPKNEPVPVKVKPHEVEKKNFDGIYKGLCALPSILFVLFDILLFVFFALPVAVTPEIFGEKESYGSIYDWMSQSEIPELHNVTVAAVVIAAIGALLGIMFLYCLIKKRRKFADKLTIVGFLFYLFYLISSAVIMSKVKEFDEGMGVVLVGSGMKCILAFSIVMLVLSAAAFVAKRYLANKVEVVEEVKSNTFVDKIKASIAAYKERISNVYLNRDSELYPKLCKYVSIKRAVTLFFGMFLFDIIYGLLYNVGAWTLIVNLTNFHSEIFDKSYCFIYLILFVVAICGVIIINKKYKPRYYAYNKVRSKALLVIGLIITIFNLLLIPATYIILDISIRDRLIQDRIFLILWILFPEGNYVLNLFSLNALTVWSQIWNIVWTLFSITYFIMICVTLSRRKKLMKALVVKKQSKHEKEQFTPQYSELFGETSSLITTKEINTYVYEKEYGKKEDVSYSSIWFKLNKVKIIATAVIAVVLVVALVSSTAIGVAAVDIFRAGKVEKIHVGSSTGEDVIQILKYGDLNEDNCFVYSYGYEIEDFDGDGLMDGYTSTYDQRITVTLEEGDVESKVKKVFLDKNYSNRIGISKKKDVKSVSLVDTKGKKLSSISREDRYSGNVIARIYYRDGSYASYAVPSKAFSGVDWSDNTITLEWSDSYGDYSCNVKVKK